MVSPFRLVSEMISPCMTLTRDMSWINIQVSPTKTLRSSRLDPKNMQIKESTRLGPGTCLSRHLQRKISPLYPCKGLLSPLGPLLIKTNLNTIQSQFYREVAMAELPSQCAEEVETFRCILDLPDPWETMPRSSTSVLGLDNKKGQQELRPRDPSSMLPLALTSKMPLISLSMIFWPLIYLRVNILNPLPPLQSGTRWDSLVMRTKSRS